MLFGLDLLNVRLDRYLCSVRFVDFRGQILGGREKLTFPRPPGGKNDLHIIIDQNVMMMCVNPLNISDMR